VATFSVFLFSCVNILFHFRHLAIGLMRVHCQALPDVMKLLPVNEQAAHSSLVGNALYGRADTEVLASSAGTELDYFWVSVIWQQLLGLSLAINLPWKMSSPTPSTSAAAPALPMRAPGPPRPPPQPFATLLQDVKALRGLQKLFGHEKALFTSVQQKSGVVHTIEGKEDLLFVSPTGSGKTLLYLLPAATQPQRTVVVIVPLKGLRLDLLHRATSLHLDVREWHSGENVDCALLLVSAEAATSEHFASTLRHLDVTRRLSWLVFEEVHLFLTSAFREHLRALLNLGTRIAPILYLSATLPPYLEQELLLATHSVPRVIRMPTTRLNLRYLTIVKTTAGAAKVEFASVVNTAIAGLEGDARVIIFVMKISECYDLIELIKTKVSLFHSDLTTQQQIASLESWRAGITPVMIATCGFGTGLDYPAVRLVIHYGGSSSILNYAQESGRAGRDGQPARCLVISYLHYRLSIPSNPDQDNNFWNLLDKKECIRALLQREVDGQGDSCIGLAGCALCSRCSDALDNDLGMMISCWFFVLLPFMRGGTHTGEEKKKCSVVGKNTTTHRFYYYYLQLPTQ